MLPYVMLWYDDVLYVLVYEYKTAELNLRKIKAELTYNMTSNIVKYTSAIFCTGSIFML